MGTDERITDEKASRRAAPLAAERSMTRPQDELFDALARLRDVSRNNSHEGSRDERDAWAGMSKELDRALRMANRAVSALTSSDEVSRPAGNEASVRVYEQTLTDGSRVYGIVVGSEVFDCSSEGEALELADCIDRLSLGARFDKWNRVRRFA